MVQLFNGVVVVGGAPTYVWWVEFGSEFRFPIKGVRHRVSAFGGVFFIPPFPLFLFFDHHIAHKETNSKSTKLLFLLCLLF